MCLSMVYHKALQPASSLAGRWEEGAEKEQEALEAGLNCKREVGEVRIFPCTVDLDPPRRLIKVQTDLLRCGNR
jgi:hypothetical protein